MSATAVLTTVRQLAWFLGFAWIVAFLPICWADEVNTQVAPVEAAHSNVPRTIAPIRPLDTLSNPAESQTTKSDQLKRPSRKDKAKTATAGQGNSDISDPLVFTFVNEMLEVSPRLKDVCRVKGQRHVLLQAVGVVVGLNGTGDGASEATARKQAESLGYLGWNTDMPLDIGGAPQNTALVVVTAVVPLHGARQDDEIDCTVTALGATSLRGGVLLLTPMLKPTISMNGEQDSGVWALAQGAVRADRRSGTKGKVRLGCQLQRDVPSHFVDGNKITLILKPSLASFALADDVAEQISVCRELGNRVKAIAIDATSIDVTIPEEYRDNTVAFVNLLMYIPLSNLR